MFEELGFRGKWRAYQARVLDELDSHLDDQHLHVVAAPGSGKTTLGLEVLIRLQKPSLILAPSLTIRDQWVSRLKEAFAPETYDVDQIISCELRQPKPLIFITYQALHAAMTGKIAQDEEDYAEEEETNGQSKPEKIDVIKTLKKVGTHTIVLDEAHHLRKEWWAVLTKVKKGLGKPTMLSLTATPPYDVEYSEWQRYEELCGSVDTEISVPELVKRGDLCPHQDYVYFSEPRGLEADQLENFKTEVALATKELLTCEGFEKAISSHPWLKVAEEDFEAILADPKMFSALIIYFNTIGYPPSRSALKLLGAEKEKIPTLTPEWLEIFLTGIFFTQRDFFPDHEETLARWQKRFQKIGCIERRRVTITDTKETSKLLANSVSKLASIVAIAEAEAKNMGDDLRMVVLTNYIRLKELPSGPDDKRPMSKLGVVPIFEHLRQHLTSDVKLGILTGSLIVAPKSASSLMPQILQQLEIPEAALKVKPLHHTPDYLEVSLEGRFSTQQVAFVTALFRLGGVTCLVGTQALLGEGWDAPSVNTLILASNIGSFMLSNQMRGRAIRIDRSSPEKASNIWHLAAIERETLMELLKKEFTNALKGYRPPIKTVSPFEDLNVKLGPDMQILKRRFRAFEGISLGDIPLIQNGIRRLNLKDAKWTTNGLQQLNERMLEEASDRGALKMKWDQSLQGKNPRPEMREATSANYAPKSLAFMDTLKGLAFQGAMGGVFWGASVLQDITQNLKYSLMGAIGVGMLVAAPKLITALYVFLRNGSLEGSMKQVGHAVLDTLYQADIIRTAPKNIELRTTKQTDGTVRCHILGASNPERHQFNTAMAQALGPVDNDRYILVRNSLLGSMLRVDYHPVPHAFAKHKKTAAFYEKCWNRYVGKSELVYTRTPKGRQLLLKARFKSTAAYFQKKTDISSIWE
ncbi:DEAD/DEAH box helicase family protein [Kordiimonas laminariae]|uniref:DEAD/DEAH box helicase family protein n=1 Tax=Kordiimonas laminariae TaxID=2917717 RepID=UPI001FF425F5|nr:DEAD/DEAH box helicase family protein [Kordiimonas laminariae]MCK0070763.1 DEAD/DEAH box helicase family protein [Kordiimonas laminariae]